MRGQFQANDEKPGWKQSVNEGIPSWVLPELRRCVDELENSFNAEPGELIQESRARVAAAAGDVANMALIVADCAHCLILPPPE